MTVILHQIIEFLNTQPPPVYLHPGDRVRVLTGDHKGKCGVIKFIAPSPFAGDYAMTAHVEGVGEFWLDYFHEFDIEYAGGAQ